METTHHLQFIMKNAKYNSKNIMELTYFPHKNEFVFFTGLLLQFYDVLLSEILELKELMKEISFLHNTPMELDNDLNPQYINQFWSSYYRNIRLTEISSSVNNTPQKRPVKRFSIFIY